MFLEWNDDHPSGSKIMLTMVAACDEHKHIDNIILSAALIRRVKLGEINAKPIIFDEKETPVVATLTPPLRHLLIVAAFWVELRSQ
ncbi:hypothetical protein [Acidovorax radicis]|jgi:hypothetical protein|uniref:hypothetical protein n=1 Tax=Acidovorax radicis TaxID=758826 RepID=UPI001CFA3D92|nr:hypothetical protein [Acidovorax radicis]UCV01011.1 hypothetical protein KI609_09890 [Acidovorax radicis]